MRLKSIGRAQITLITQITIEISMELAIILFICVIRVICVRFSFMRPWDRPHADHADYYRNLHGISYNPLYLCDPCNLCEVFFYEAMG
jgi:hypothetical protein